MTPAEKQRAYRERKLEQVLLVDVGALASASRVTLLERLTRDLLGIEAGDDGDVGLTDERRHSAGQILAELVRRYSLKLRK